MAQKNSSKTLKSDVSEFQNGFLLNEYGSARCENWPKTTDSNVRQTLFLTKRNGHTSDT